MLHPDKRKCSANYGSAEKNRREAANSGDHQEAFLVGRELPHWFFVISHGRTLRPASPVNQRAATAIRVMSTPIASRSVAAA